MLQNLEKKHNFSGKCLLFSKKMCKNYYFSPIFHSFYVVKGHFSVKIGQKQPFSGLFEPFQPFRAVKSGAKRLNYRYYGPIAVKWDLQLGLRPLSFRIRAIVAELGPKAGKSTFLRVYNKYFISRSRVFCYWGLGKDKYLRISQNI